MIQGIELENIQGMSLQLSENSLHDAVNEADDPSVVEILSPNNQIYTKRNVRIIALNLLCS